MSNTHTQLGRSNKKIHRIPVPRTGSCAQGAVLDPSRTRSQAETSPREAGACRFCRVACGASRTQRMHLPAATRQHISRENMRRCFEIDAPEYIHSLTRLRTSLSDRRGESRQSIITSGEKCELAYNLTSSGDKPLKPAASAPGCSVSSHCIHNEARSCSDGPAAIRSCIAPGAPSGTSKAGKSFAVQIVRLELSAAVVPCQDTHFGDARDANHR